MKTSIETSIVIITWNSEKKLSICLDYIINQNYSKDKLEIIIVDGGSSDNTLSVAKNYQDSISIKIIKTNVKDQEPKRAIGAKIAKGKYICSIDPDNYLIDSDWLQKMLKPLKKDPTLSGSQTLYYAYSRKESLINRYFALFGVNDPVVFYLGKADRIPHYETKWLFNKEFVDRGNYFEVNFDKDIPTLGCNGAIFRADQYLKVIKDPEDFFHIDVVYDLVKKGFNKYAIVKNSILHSTGSTFWGSILKRASYMGTHYYKKQNKRRYFVFDPSSDKDRRALLKFVFFTLTIFQPLSLSIRGYVSKRDLAWFLHWPMCLGFLFVYAYMVINKLIHPLNYGSNA